MKIKHFGDSAKRTVEEPGKNVKAKTAFNRSLLDVGIGAFFRMLDFKSQWYGKEFVKVAPKCTS
jgi:putative transposase